MKLAWTSKALSDISRLHDFIKCKNPEAAARITQALVNAPGVLLQNPRLGEQLFQFAPREVRRLMIGGNYEMRYENAESTVRILRIWHTKKSSVKNRRLQ